MQIRHIFSRISTYTLVVAMIFTSFTVIPADAMETHGDSGMSQEHIAVMSLVDVSDVTHASVQDGNWSDPSTWGGAIPTDGARVQIAAGHDIIVDTVIPESLMTVRVDGTLRFATDVDTELTVDTLVTSPDSFLIIGTEENPIDDDVTARITIQDYNNEGIETEDLDSPDYDPLKVGLGIITHGKFIAYGEEKTDRVAMDGASAGDTTLIFDTIPENWNVGDELVVAGVTKKASDETRTIAEISGNEVVLDSALENDHNPPKTVHEDGLKVHVVNLTRNIVLETAIDNQIIEDAETEEEKYGKRGHLMFMHNNDVGMYYTQINHFGRTIKSHAVHDSRLDENGNATRIGTNPRARYSLHFHKGGHETDPGHIVGNVVVNSPGWGYVNHSSYVHMLNNISYDISGSAFVTEVGDEVGSFIGNTAIRNVPFTKPSRTAGGGDTGRGGSGFWNHATAIDLRDNVVSGFNEKGIFFWGDVIATNIKTGQPVLRQGRNIVPAKFLTGIPVSGTNVSSELPVNSISNNTVYGGDLAFSLFRKKGTTTRYNHVNDLTTYNVDRAVTMNYSIRVVIKNLVAVGNVDDPVNGRGSAVGQTRGGFNIRLVNPHIEGFYGGWSMPIRGKGHPATVEGGYFNNLVGIYNYVGQENQTVISGDIKFGKLSEEALNGFKQANIASGRRVHRYDTAHSVVTSPDLRYIDKDDNVYRVYAVAQQSPDFIPHPTGVKVVNRGYKAFKNAFKGKTNAQLMELYGVTFAGRMLPEDAIHPDDWKNAAMAPIVGATIPQINIEDIHVDQSNAVFNEAGEVVITTPLSQGGNMIVVTDVTQPATGKVRVGNFNRSLIYTPTEAGSIDDVSFEFSVSNGMGDYETRTVTIGSVITPEPEPEPEPNTEPVAVDDSATTEENVATTVHVLMNDIDADGDSLHVTGVTDGAYGTTVINADNTVTYNPYTDFSGEDSFTYVVSDGNGGEASAQVTVSVTEVIEPEPNTTPTAVDDHVTTQPNMNPTISVLSNDTDADGDTLVVTSVTNGSYGTVVVNIDNTVTYTPETDYEGDDTFTYTISDGNGGEAVGTVMVHLVPTPIEPPVEPTVLKLKSEKIYFQNKEPKTIPVLQNDQGDGLQIVSVSKSKKGKGIVILNDDNTVTYDPIGKNRDSFTYTVEDAYGNRATQTVEIQLPLKGNNWANYKDRY